ncbi:hypothetical protein V8D89_015860 [Ganoderma adspersum]
MARSHVIGVAASTGSAHNLVATAVERSKGRRKTSHGQSLMVWDTPSTRICPRNTFFGSKHAAVWWSPPGKPQWSPSQQGLTEYRYNPATLPKYNARKMLKCKIVKGAQLMSRLQNNDEGGEGDEDKELEGEAPEGDIAKEQDKEDVSEQAEEEMDDPDDSEGSAVDLMPCKRSSHHMSRIYKCRRIDSSPAVDDDLNVIQDYGDAGLTTNLELQAALDVPLYEDELTTLMNFHTEQSWPEITAEDTQEREEQPYNNTAHEEMAEQVEQMDAVSRQAGDGEQPMEKASAMNAPNVLDINPAEYEVSAIDRDNQVFAMRIHGLRMRHQALLSEEMTTWTLHERIERTERALTNLLFRRV